MTTPERPNPSMPAPPGFHHEAIEEPSIDWQVPPVSDGGCRFTERGVRCGKPPTASLYRGSQLTKTPWNYCSEHMFGRWIERGRVMVWRLVAGEAEEEPQPESAPESEPESAPESEPEVEEEEEGAPVEA